MLKPFFEENQREAGCDEAGRGCLAGPVFAASVILKSGFSNELINDSKKLSEKQRYLLRDIIQEQADEWAVEMLTNKEIDEVNILNASFMAMNKAVKKFKNPPSLLLIDGNRFRNQTEIPYKCIVKGDALYASIAAASILAKTYRDDFMKKIAKEFPHFGWESNKGYPTADHYRAISEHGICKYHRRSFNLNPQLNLF